MDNELDFASITAFYKLLMPLLVELQATTLPAQTS